MPGRNIALSNGNYYHVLNRAVAYQKLFLEKDHYDRALELLNYYRNSKPPLRYSYFLRLPPDSKSKILKDLSCAKDFLVEILAFSLMPNHIHLLVKQIKDNGISIFMGRFQNSFTRYFNRKNTRAGHIFGGNFKAVRISSEEQLIHVIRYIKLNPLSAGVVKNFEELEQFPYASLSEYLGGRGDGYICSKDYFLSRFGSLNELKTFISDNKDYQIQLQNIKRDILESYHTSKV
ncbi:hypothetical protein AUJ94_00150 [bacterium CG2_30_40_12]|nr:MAG: hypothetical protein AUJ94_00150 [bacterium CG2_30_40_12]